MPTNLGICLTSQRLNGRVPDHPGVQHSLTTVQEPTVINRKHLVFTLTGGTVSHRFTELFGASSRGGMYDRFTLGSCRDVALLEAPLYGLESFYDSFS